MKEITKLEKNDKLLNNNDAYEIEQEVLAYWKERDKFRFLKNLAEKFL